VNTTPDGRSRPGEITLAHGIRVTPEFSYGMTPDLEAGLFLAVDVDLKPWAFNFGVGRGFGDDADRWTVKAIIEVPSD
jgi:hypothetical protein